MGDDIMLKRTEIMHALHRRDRYYIRSQFLKVSIITLFSLTMTRQNKVKSKSNYYPINSLFLCLLTKDFEDARKHGDGERILRLMKFMMLLFRCDGKFKYGYHILHHIAQVKVFLPAKLAHDAVWNRFINHRGQGQGDRPSQPCFQNRLQSIHWATVAVSNRSHNVIGNVRGVRV